MFTDEIENQGFEEQPLCFLYHCNAGYPFLVPGLRIVMPSIMTGPRDAAAEAGKSRGKDSQRLFYGSDHHFCDPDSSFTVVWPLHALDFWSQ